MKHGINPLNLDYKYQFKNKKDAESGLYYLYKETADPSAIVFNGLTYIFSSMCLGVYVSSDLIDWEWHSLAGWLPCYDYAPDVKVHDGYVYFTASRHHADCSVFRTKDVLNGPYEEYPTHFRYWDPCLYFDDDGRVFLYQGSSDLYPLDVVELDRKSFRRIGERVVTVSGDIETKGFERFGEDHKKTHIFTKPFMEGSWMTKHDGRYYLQYGTPGTEINVYGDGVYVSDSPVGPFALAENNPFSYAPGSFMPGAGHGSTFEKDGKFYHTSTMRISINDNCERRIGIWKAGFDGDGELFCDQNYNDWPVNFSKPVFSDPDYMLLSYKKQVAASSQCDGFPKENVTDENCQTFFKAKGNKDEWVVVDLGGMKTVNFVQINFADAESFAPLPEGRRITSSRYIDEISYPYKWRLECSADGKNYAVLKEQLCDNVYQSHPVFETEEGVRARYIRLSVFETPYNANVTLSALRVFGKGDGELPVIREATAVRTSPLDMTVRIDAANAVGYNICWGHAADKLYHSYLTYKAEQDIGALIKGKDVYVRVDAFNEAGITKGKVFKL